MSTNNTSTDLTQVFNMDKKGRVLESQKQTLKTLELLVELQLSQKKAVDASLSELKLLIKKQNKLINKPGKRIKVKTDQKPQGFAIPTKIGDDLAELLGKDKNTVMARTQVTSLIAKYVRDNKLQNPLKKKEIIPNAALERILSPEAKGMVLTHFSLQKYINHNFIKPDVVSPANVVA